MFVRSALMDLSHDLLTAKIKWQIEKVKIYRISRVSQMLLSITVYVYHVTHVLRVHLHSVINWMPRKYLIKMTQYLKIKWLQHCDVSTYLYGVVDCVIL